MNKFLGKKKTAPEPLNETALAALTAPPPVSPGPRKTSGSKWKKSKKQTEAKPSLDLQLSNALPASDAFRTSLLMPNLSARFSMLREQDDPNSKIGKASDDSVLHPPRRPRMPDFGYSGSTLNDIAEVQSIHGSIRPPFAFHNAGTDDGYGSESDVVGRDNGQGGIMGRARPGEGNTMFGGRQKVYKIAPHGKATGLGKAVYEDDIGSSAFQKWRKQEREQQAFRASEESIRQYLQADDESQHRLFADSSRDLAHSPSWMSDNAYSNTSSIGRSDQRSSTAATSIVSQPGSTHAHSPLMSPSKLSSTAGPAANLKRQDTKNRRLYETGLDQHILDQQASAMSRLNSFQKNRQYQLPHLHGVKSAGTLHERPQIPAVARSGSKGSESRGNGSLYGSQPQSPTNPDFLPSLANDDALALALEPADRGKATAMGAFNKPSQQFDEHEYLERQQQLQSVHASSVAQQASNRLQQERARSNSNTSLQTRSRSGSFHRSIAEKDGYYNSSTHPSVQKSPKRSPLPDTHRTFFGNISGSDSDEDESENSVRNTAASRGNRSYQINGLSSVSEHPALRGDSARQSQNGEDYTKTGIPGRPQNLFVVPRPYLDNKGIDSPTLGPGNGHALNGMVHHLRQRSNQSSIYPNDEDNESVFGNDEQYTQQHTLAKNLEYGPRSGYAKPDTDSGIGSSTSQSNPWDREELEARNDLDISAMTSSIREKMRLPSASENSKNLNPGSRLALGMQDLEPIVLPWQTELRKQAHLRDGSSATQQERDAFANELAVRRTAIQENIKQMVAEGQSSRNASPARTPSSTALKALSKLRSKPSHEVFSSRHNPNSTLPNSSTSSLNTETEKQSFSSEMSRPRNAMHPAFQAANARDRSASRSRPGIQTSSLQRPLQLGDSMDFDLNSAMERAKGLPSHSVPRNGGTRSRSQSNAGRNNNPQRGRSDARQTSYGDLSSRLPPVERESRASSEKQQPINQEHFARSNDYADVTSGLDGMPSIGRDYTVHSTSRPALESTTNSSSTITSARPAILPLQSSATSSSTSMGQTSPTSVPPQRSFGNSLRKKSISKNDISEPVLISSTSNVDTVELPPGASLRNGMSDAPPLPPINPKRRVARKIFGLGRNDGYDHGIMASLATSTAYEAGQGNGRGRRSDSSNEEYMLRGTTSTPNLSSTQLGYNSTHAGKGYGPVSPPRMPSYETPAGRNMF